MPASSASSLGVWGLQTLKAIPSTELCLLPSLAGKSSEPTELSDTKSSPSLRGQKVDLQYNSKLVIPKSKTQFKHLEARESNKYHSILLNAKRWAEP